MKALAVILSLLLVIALAALHVSPELWWGVAFVGLLAPFVWIANAVLLVIFLIKLRHRPSWWILIPALSMVAGIGLFFDSIALSPQENTSEQCLQVLSYNVSHFGKPRRYLRARDSLLLDQETVKTFINWSVQHPAPIKCFQEFFHFSNDRYFNVDQQLKAAGWANGVISADTLSVNKSRFGLAIYSTYPILNSKTIFVGKNGFNRAMWADVQIGSQTLRIFNVHLQSAQLQFVHYRTKNSGRLQSLRNIFWQYRNSLVERNKQIKLLLTAIEQSPHPIILCGDLNSTPYSHVYKSLEERLNNTFEARGQGFGFTFNHPKLFFLRIDHQFSSSALRACGFKTRNDIKWSAHHPLEGWYQPVSSATR